MKTLKDIKEALNKMPDDVLEDFFITHLMWLEDPEAEIGVCFECSEEDMEKHEKLFDHKAYPVLKQFARDINSDAMKVACAKLNEDLIEEQYAEDEPERDN